MGTTVNQKKLFFNLRKVKSQISALNEGDMRSEQVTVVAERLGVGANPRGHQFLDNPNGRRFRQSSPSLKMSFGKPICDRFG